MKQLAPFHRNIGIELTFLPNEKPKFTSNNEYGFERSRFFLATGEMTKMAEGALGYPLPGNPFRSGLGSIDTDPGCTEWSSPILKTWDAAKSFYDCATVIGEMCGLTTYHKDQVGGMGHIHMAMGWNKALRITDDLIGRPYLSWLFAEPVQGEFCQSLHNFYSNYNLSRSGRLFLAYPCNLFPIVRYSPDYDTLEWRGFDSAINWEEQEEHIAFYQAYVQAVLTGKLRKVEGDPAMLLIHYRNSKRECIQAFRDLIEELALPWDRYEWYTRGNLKAQFEWGERL